MLEKFQGEKRKQYLILAGALAVGAVGILFLSEMGGTSKREQPPAPPVKIVDEKKVREESFRGVYGRKLKQQEEEIKKLRAQLEKLELKLRQKEEEVKKMKDAPPRFSFVPPPPQTAARPPNPPPPRSSGSGTGVSPPPPPPPAPGKAGKPPQKEFLKDLIVLDLDEKSEGKPPEVKEKPKRAPGMKSPSAGEVIPAGSFVKGILLNGLNAPAGGKALSNPLPVLIRLSDLTVLPNRWRVDIRECFVIGAGYGDLSSERAYVRAETLSCVRKNGKVLTAKVDGYVSGEDGKVGLAGRVVTKQGQILARTLMAGFLEGVSRAFQQSSTFISVSPLGTTQTIKPEDAFEVGMFAGAGEAMKKLADFYMKLANQMFPVIEVNAGRHVDVVFLKNVNLEEGEK